MSMPDDNRPPGPLARIGQSPSAAGLSRVGIAFLTVVLTGLVAWGAHDLDSMLDRINENSKAIIALGDRTTHVEDKADLALTSSKEFRLWTEGRVNDLTAQINANSRQTYDVNAGLTSANNRIHCLENKSRCPP